MKKLFLALAVIATIYLSSCKNTSGETETSTTDSVSLLIDTLLISVDTSTFYTSDAEKTDTVTTEK